MGTGESFPMERDVGTRFCVASRGARGRNNQLHITTTLVDRSLNGPVLELHDPDILGVTTLVLTRHTQRVSMELAKQDVETLYEELGRILGR